MEVGLQDVQCLELVLVERYVGTGWHPHLSFECFRPATFIHHEPLYLCKNEPIHPGKGRVPKRQLAEGMDQRQVNVEGWDMDRG